MMVDERFGHRLWPDQNRLHSKQVRHGEVAGQEIVARVAGLHPDDFARMTQRFNFLTQYHFHD